MMMTYMTVYYISRMFLECMTFKEKIARDISKLYDHRQSNESECLIFFVLVT